MISTDNLTPSAFLFFDATAAYFDHKGNSVEALQHKGWRGLHGFVDCWGDRNVHMQGTGVLSSEMVSYMLSTIRKPKIAQKMRIDDV